MKIVLFLVLMQLMEVLLEIENEQVHEDSNTSESCVGNTEPEQVHEDSAISNTATTSSTNGNYVRNYDSEQVQHTSSNWHGFKLVGDNLDKNIRYSFCRSDKNTQSLHCFHYYAALDRVICHYFQMLPLTWKLMLINFL